MVVVKQNDVLMQYFEWYLPDDGNLWKQLKDDAAHLQKIGISNLWMPPASKATGSSDTGYGIYDLFDLGEFDQKGTIRTKYGTKDEYIEAIKTLKEHNIRPIADVVLNHKAGADEKEMFKVLKMDPDNRQETLSEPYNIEAWTHFTFPGRKGKYNEFEWHYYHFTGTDYDALNDETGVYLILGENKGWADNESVDSEKGNFDYLMFTDIDYSHPEVIQNIKEWARWFIETTGIQGFRLDAIKHIDAKFVEHFIQAVTEAMGEEFYIFGEYWQADYDAKLNYLEAIDYEFDLFDVGLHMNLFEASKQGKDYDLRKVFDNTLMLNNPWNAVTFVDNHDTQKGQALESEVDEWFKPLAYGLILLREEGLPCLFYGDYYGTNGDNAHEGYQGMLDTLLYVRKYHAYGEQIDYFDHHNCIGWVRLGNDEHPDGVAVVLSNSEEGWKEMNMGPANAGKVFVDYLNHHEAEVTITEDGSASFPVNAGSISAWVNKEAHYS